MKKTTITVNDFVIGLQWSNGKRFWTVTSNKDIHFPIAQVSDNEGNVLYNTQIDAQCVANAINEGKLTVTLY